MSLPHFTPRFLLSLEPFVPSWLHLPLARFDRAKDDTFPGVFHEIVKEDKGKELILEDFRSPPPIDIKDMEVSPLHVVFNLKRVFVGKEYFRTNHLLLALFDLAQGCTLQSENVVPRLTLKEFLLKCLEKFIVYIWTSISLAKMNAYLKKITKEMGLEINPQRIMGQNLCKINEHFLQFPYKTYLNHINCLTFNLKIYHKIFFKFLL